MVGREDGVRGSDGILRRKYAVRGIQQVVYRSGEVIGACESGKERVRNSTHQGTWEEAVGPSSNTPRLPGEQTPMIFFKFQPPTCSSSSHRQRTTLFRRSTSLQLPFIRGCFSPSMLEDLCEVQDADVPSDTLGFLTSKASLNVQRSMSTFDSEYDVRPVPSGHVMLAY